MSDRGVTGSPIFAADSCARRFGRRQVLSSASAWAWPGRISALIGRNGCGKSTLLKIAVGLLRAHGGAVIFDDYRPARPSLADLALRGLFYWPDFHLLPIGPTVGELLEMVKLHVPDASVDEAIEVARLQETLRQTTHTLSGGERRRVELGLVLARRPLCLLADEPFRGVEPGDRDLFVSAFRHLSASGCAILVTGHEVESLFEVADDVIWMVAGTTHHIGTPADARRHDQFRREYLGR